MDEPALQLGLAEEAAAEEAAKQTTKLIVIEGGKGASVEAGEVAVGEGVGEGILAGATLATVAAAFFVLLWPSDIAPEPTIGPAPARRPKPVPVPNPKPVTPCPQQADSAGVAALLSAKNQKDIHPQSPPLTEGIIKLECDPTWDDCQKQQAREKIRRLNELAKKNGLKRRRTAGRIRDLGNIWAGKYRRDFNRLLQEDMPPPRFGFTHPEVSGPTGTKSDFMADCIYQQWTNSKSTGQGDTKSPPLNHCSPDHVQDLQWGGHVQGQLVWLDRDVNEKLGRDMSAGDNNEIDVAKGFELKCP